MRKPATSVDQLTLKPACSATATEACKSHGTIAIILSWQGTIKALISLHICACAQPEVSLLFPYVMNRYSQDVILRGSNNFSIKGR